METQSRLMVTTLLEVMCSSALRTTSDDQQSVEFTVVIRLPEKFGSKLIGNMAAKQTKYQGSRPKRRITTQMVITLEPDTLNWTSSYYFY